MSDSSDAAVSVSWASRQRGKKPPKNNINNVNSLTEAGINTDRCFQPILTLRPSVEVASFLAGHRRNIVFTFIFLPPNTFKPLVSNSTTVSFDQSLLVLKLKLTVRFTFAAGHKLHLPHCMSILVRATTTRFPKCLGWENRATGNILKVLNKVAVITFLLCITWQVCLTDAIMWVS